MRIPNTHLTMSFLCKGMIIFKSFYFQKKNSPLLPRDKILKHLFRFVIKYKSFQFEGAKVLIHHMF